MTFECEYCKKSFKNNYLLNRHKSTTKYCLNIQQERENNEDIKIKNTDCVCDYCDKILKNKQNLNIHIASCKKKFLKKEYEFLEQKENFQKQISETCENYHKQISEIKEKFQKQILEAERHLSDIKQKYEKQNLDVFKYNCDIEHKDEIIEEYKRQLRDLQDRLERVHIKAIEKPTSINTTTNNKFDLKCFSLSQENINNKISSKFNDDYMYNGMSGIARFVKDHIITLEDGSIIFACYDKSRQIFKYKDKDGNIINDPKALKLIAMIQPALKEQSQVLLDFFDNEYDTIDKDDKNEMRKIQNQKEFALKIGVEISNMHENQKFSNELSNIIS
jgi:hypothetical protein